MTHVINLGNVTSISAVSDERDKTDIVDLPVGLDPVNSLRPVKFAIGRKWFNGRNPS